MPSHAGGEALARPRAARIVAFERLSDRHVAFEVADPHLARTKAGQFAMLWIPGVDEVPMGVSTVDPERGTAWFLVLEVGDCTRAMGRLKAGDRIGVRGPYGRPFAVPKAAKTLLVGGGTGTAPLLAAVDEVHATGGTATVVPGARTKDLLVWLDRFEAAADAVHPCTDDGSLGHHGFTTGKTEELLATGAFDLVLTCGPEIMMVKVAEAARRHGVPCQVSVERWMKCGVGVCGSCVMGDGVRACVEGPCIPAEVAERLPDWGHYHRGPDGNKMPLH
ncbi:MAG: dihydroorotate dehydrogenase electron transfer subunit [Euryarchaeota archaeon]|nr:dihydroorotate dehydrogenase electron transfer subunit [Euryarchaeota archaeon]